MKLILEINNTKLLLTTEQVNTLVTLLHGCEQIKHEYLGRGNKGSDYADFIRLANMQEVLKLGVLSDIAYDAMVFITKQQDAST